MREKIDTLWQDLLEKDDRTSPAEYPDMALITYDEFADYVTVLVPPVALFPTPNLIALVEEARVRQFVLSEEPAPYADKADADLIRRLVSALGGVSP